MKILLFTIALSIYLRVSFWSLRRNVREILFQCKRNSGGVTRLHIGTDDERWLELMTYKSYDIEKV
jgi:hypothetical protein